MQTIAHIILTRRWCWRGHILHIPPNSLSRLAHRETPRGRETGEPKDTYEGGTVIRYFKSQCLSMKSAPPGAVDRTRCRTLAVASSSRRRGEEYGDWLRRKRSINILKQCNYYHQNVWLSDFQLPVLDWRTKILSYLPLKWWNKPYRSYVPNIYNTLS